MPQNAWHGGAAPSLFLLVLLSLGICSKPESVTDIVKLALALPD